MSSTVRPPGTFALPAPRPTVTDDNRPYWTGAREGRLVLPRCSRCRTVIWYPKHFCAACDSVDVEWFEASGRGTLYSYTVTRRSAGTYGESTPYVYAYVELDEGPRVVTNIVDSTARTLVIGAPVTAVFEACDDEIALVRFRIDTVGR